MMRASGSVLAAVLFLLLLTPGHAKFDQLTCDLNADPGTKQDVPIPYFQDEFSVLMERADFINSRGGGRAVSHQKLLFSDGHRQAMLYHESKDQSYWMHVDEHSSDCVYRKNDGPCEDTLRTCIEARIPMGFINIDSDGKLDLGTAAGIFRWPAAGSVPLKKEVKTGKTESRSIKCDEYVTCTYDEATDRTTVTQWAVLDPASYKDLDPTRPLLVSDYHLISHGGVITLEERTDYANVKPLSSFQQRYGLQIGENECGAIQSDFMTRTIPKPPRKFRSAVEMISFKSQTANFGFAEYNYNSELEMSFLSEANKDSPVEEDKTVFVYDFSASHIYQYSETRGDCEVLDLASVHSEKMQTPEDFWHLNAGKSAYLGVFVDRDIPCDVWRFDYSKEGDDETQEDSVTLYLATAEWLKEQDRPRDEFHPVRLIRRKNDDVVFHSYFEFNTHPGYHIPDLPTCFDQDDIINGMVTLKANYYQTIAPSGAQFADDFRDLLRKVTGIKSFIRFGDIGAIPSPDSPDKTLVAFSLYGLFKNVDSSRTSFYEMDPVTNRQAAAKINAMVDQGTVQFRLGTQSVSMTFKKGSFAEVSNNGRLHPRYMDRPNQGGSASYSSGAMAGVGIAVLLVGMLLAIGAVFFYKRWTEGGGTGLSFSMQGLSDSA